MRPQFSQYMMVWLASESALLSRRSFQRCGRTIIWHAVHFWLSASDTAVPLPRAMRS